MKKLGCLFACLAALIGGPANAAGFDGRYAAYQGDLNGDGRPDLYIKWTPAISLIALDDFSIPVPTSRRGVADFVLLQANNSAFTLASLSAGDRSVVRQWPRAAPGVQIAPADVNFDGATDLMVSGLASVAANAVPQIVMASSAAGVLPPTKVIPLSPGLQAFYVDVARWFVAPLITERIEVKDYTYLGYQAANATGTPLACAPYPNRCVFRIDDVDDAGAWNPVNDPGKEDVQHFFGYTTEVRDVTRRNYDVTNVNAGPFVDALKTTIEAGEINPGFYTDVMQNIFNTVYGQAGVINMLRNPTPDIRKPKASVDEMPEALFDDWRWGRLMTSIFGILWEVCKYGGDDPTRCWAEVAAPALPHISTCHFLGPFDAGGPYFNYEITLIQRELAGGKQRRQFWVSRYQDNCDPFALSALGVVDERGLGLVTLKWLRAIAAQRGLTLDEKKLGLDIMDAHVLTTDGDTFGIRSLLSKRQITRYHVDVFKAYGLPDYTFGGAPFGVDSVTGGFFEWFLGEWMWCPDCDKVP